MTDQTPDLEPAAAATEPPGTVIHRTPDELRAQRARLIASTGMSEEVLRERGETWQLYPEHQDVWETVRGIDYLLGDDSADDADGGPGEVAR